MARTKQSINILNRLVTWTERGIELEGDARPRRNYHPRNGLGGWQDYHAACEGKN